MSKFDAAIDSIRGYLRVMEAYSSKHEKDISESYAAIRVLEAAGKVDKELAINTLRRFYHPKYNQDKDPASVPLFDHIMLLLESLPGKEE